MIIIKHPRELKEYLETKAVMKGTIGFVPTMGALHAGHLSLLEKCNEKCNISVCSIFVNPMQFNNRDDFNKYPKTIEKDLLLLEENSCDILFLPGQKEIYPDEISKKKYFDLGYLETILEGKFRPGHFQGVCLVVEKLLNIVEPDFLFLGQKDFQQCLVIKRLIELMQIKIQLVICPIVREESGLALSSRNLRLNNHEKQTASNLYQSLVSIKQNLSNENFLSLKDKAIHVLEKKGFKVEYLEFAKAGDLTQISTFREDEELIILIAAFLNEVRLIDNLLINPVI